jgi:uridine phosphorylase
VPHIQPTNELAPRALLVGDPGRALALAQQLLTSPLMFNHHRGLWGYSGAARDGQLLTIQATGVGGPSAAAVLGELCDLGLQVAVRAGTCRAVADIAPGTILAVAAAVAGDGASRALGAGARVAPDPDLTAVLTAAAGGSAVVHSADVYTGAVNGGRSKSGTRLRRKRRLRHPLVRDLSTAAILQLARVRGIRAGAVLAVVDGEHDEQTTAALGEAAAAALI